MVCIQLSPVPVAADSIAAGRFQFQASFSPDGQCTCTFFDHRSLAFQVAYCIFFQLKDQIPFHFDHRFCCVQASCFQFVQSQDILSSAVSKCPASFPGGLSIFRDQYLFSFDLNRSKRNLVSGSSQIEFGRYKHSKSSYSCAAGCHQTDKQNGAHHSSNKFLRQLLHVSLPPVSC